VTLPAIVIDDRPEGITPADMAKPKPTPKPSRLQ
jgi:hypothetical protein